MASPAHRARVTPARRLTQDGTGRPDADASPPTALRSLRRSSRYGSVARLVGGAPRRPELRLPSWVNLLAHGEPEPPRRDEAGRARRGGEGEGGEQEAGRRVAHERRRGEQRAADRGRCGGGERVGERERRAGRAFAA